MKIFISTFGCKVNQYESESILENFYKIGYIKTETFIDADVIIINSCTVTGESDKKIKRTLHKMRTQNKNAIIVLTGCMPQAFPEEAGELKDADIILGNSQKNEIFQAILEFIKNRDKIVRIKPCNRETKFEKMSISSGFNERTRAFLKIEDGCNRFCSYCIIPYARGRVRSKSVDDILSELKVLACNGYKEIVLVGINLSSYGSDLGITLCDAIEAACSVDGIKRVRLGSLEPEQMDEYTIKRLSKQDKLCPQFHLSLQSGCDRILRRMNRHYSSKEYLNIVENLRKYFNNVSITTDIMVGFPGETEEDFKESLEFAKKVGFSKVHVFSYSVRKGTKAAEFEDQVYAEVKKQRSKIMISVTDKIRNEFLKSQIYKIEPVLYEVQNDKGYFEGYTKNYTPIKVKSEHDLHGNIIMTKIIGVENGYCIGEIIKSI